MLLVSFHFVYTNLDVDGGWYSYPAYALTQGGDPNENQRPVAQYVDEGRLVASFSFFTKNNIRVLPLTAWFSLIEPSFASLKVFGLLELALLWAIFAICAFSFSKSRATGVCLLLLFVLDRVVLELGINDLRPDLFLVTLALAVLFCLNKLFDTSRSELGHTMVWAVGALLFCLLLALTHVTAVVSLSVVLVYATLKYLQTAGAEKANRYQGPFFFLVSLLWLTAILAFFLKGSLLDEILVSKIVPDANLFRKLSELLGASPLEIATKEYLRWKTYLFWGNLHLLLLFALLLVSFIHGLAIHKSKLSFLLESPLTVASVAGVLALTLLDPHSPRFHATTVTPFLLLASTEIQPELLRRFSRRYALRLLVLIACVSTLVSGLSNWSQAASSGKENNWELQLRLRGAFSKATSTTGELNAAFGPAELWPYLGRNTEILLMDRRSWDSIRLAPDAVRASYVIINNSYRRNKFLEHLEAATPNAHWVLFSAYPNNPEDSVTVLKREHLDASQRTLLQSQSLP